MDEMESQRVLKLFGCEFCDYFFREYDYLVKHIKHTHNDKYIQMLNSGQTGQPVVPQRNKPQPSAAGPSTTTGHPPQRSSSTTDGPRSPGGASGLPAQTGTPIPADPNRPPGGSAAGGHDRRQTLPAISVMKDVIDSLQESMAERQDVIRRLREENRTLRAALERQQRLCVCIQEDRDT